MLRPAFFQSFYESTTNGWQNAWHQWVSPQESQQDINGKMRFSARKHHIATQKVISWFVNPINYTIVIGVMFTNLANELGHHLADSSLLICHLTLVVLLKTLGLLVVNPRSLLRIDVAGGAILVDWLVEVHMKYRTASRDAVPWLVAGVESFLPSCHGTFIQQRSRSPVFSDLILDRMIFE